LKPAARRNGQPGRLAGGIGVALWSADRGNGLPGIGDRLINEEGNLLGCVDIFVGEEFVGDETVRYTGHFANRPATDAQISILPAGRGG
jgi:hypothetical protein